jgi:predicted site-specific integrase-resolvase
MTNLQNYLSIKDAAEFVGVSPGTLRNWDRAGKIATHRNPLNGYRLYKKSELEILLRTIERQWHSRSGVAPRRREESLR